METTDDSRQPLDDAGTKAPLVLESVSPSALLDEVIRRVAERDDLERRAIEAERERDGWKSKAEHEEIRHRQLGDALAIAIDGERWAWIGDGNDDLDSMSDTMAISITAGQIRAEVERLVEREVDRATAYLRRERDEANARIKELERQGDRRHARILAEEVATLRGPLANMNASRDEVIRQRDRLMHTSLEGWHLLSVAAQRMLATLKGADVDGDVTLDPREIAVMLDCEQRNVADLVRGARARETWQERVREEIRAVTDRVLQVKP